MTPREVPEADSLEQETPWLPPDVDRSSAPSAFNALAVSEADFLEQLTPAYEDLVDQD